MFCCKYVALVEMVGLLFMHAGFFTQLAGALFYLRFNRIANLFFLMN